MDKEHPAPGTSEEQAGGVPRRLVVTAALILAVVASVIVYGYLARPKPEWVGVADKNVWDWLDLLVVPAALAIGVYWLNTRQAARQKREEDRRQAREEAAQEAQVQHALEAEDQRAQDAALQAYLEQMSHLLTDPERPLRRSYINDDLSIVARARTLTVLPRLDGGRKARVAQFLYESGSIARRRPLLDLRGADFSGANLRGVPLDVAHLIGVNLRGATLIRLHRADLSGATLNEADLRGADLAEAFLYLARLIGADLSGANLSGADLTGANLTDAKGVTNEELQRAASLRGATMPDGRKYEDWLESQGGGENGENPES